MADTRSPAVRVVRPGLLTTIQDLGRWGWQAWGVPVAGPMDVFAHRRANLLIDNPRDAATLEVTLVGPELEFEDSRLVAVTGASFALTVDGRGVPLESPFEVPRFGRLAFGQRRRGARAYLAIHGGVDLPPVLGSRATHLPSRIGGLDGRSLVAGDRVPLGPTSRKPLPSVQRSTQVVEDLDIVRVLEGPQVDFFDPHVFDVLESEPYTIGVQSDRIGFRLEGPVLRSARGSDIISDAAPLGAVQVPASGQPIVLMADRQTTGGYPKVAAVISADIGVLGQLAPGDRVRFRRCTHQEALQALIAREQALLAIEGRRS